MQCVGYKHPPLTTVTSLDLVDEYFIVRQGCRNFYSLHIPGCVDVNKCFLFTHGIPQSLGAEISEAHTNGLALRFFSKIQNTNNTNMLTRCII